MKGVNKSLSPPILFDYTAISERILRKFGLATNTNDITHSTTPQNKNISAGAFDDSGDNLRRMSSDIPKTPIPIGIEAVDSVLYKPKILPCIALGVDICMIVFKFTTILAITIPIM